MSRQPERLSIEVIEDPLHRAALYRELRQPQDDWIPHDIKVDERLMAELIAYRRYKTAQLKWAILVICGLNDPRGELTPGETIMLPPITWIRDRLHHYAKLGLEV